MRVIFDEAHSEAWTIRPDLAMTMQPSHPADASYATAARVLADRGAVVSAHADGLLDADRLADADLLVIAHPSAPEWEATTGVGSPQLSAGELDAIEAHVRAGGGLIVLGETEQAKYANNLNELLHRFGVSLANHTVQDYEHHAGATPSWVRARLGDGGRGSGGDLLARVDEVVFYRATTIEAPSGARVLARTYPTASVPSAALAVSVEAGRGRVVVLADSDLFGDDCIGAGSHRQLWENLCLWAARVAGVDGAADAASGVLAPGVAAPEVALPENWGVLRDATNALGLLQAPDGSLAEGADVAEAAAHVEVIARELRAAAQRIPDQAEYLTLAAADLERWRTEGFARPDFSASLEAFRPDTDRANGRLHLVFFPMYKQNGSRDTCFETLVVRVPWPDWIAELEATRFDNPKFVPVELIDATRGYDSDCAVLFPEMVATSDRPPNHFGAIFCDRESARLRRVATAAADLLALNLPPDAARMLASPGIAQEAYILWDLIHDRAHSHGELPFDPFMIRQRSPYWMYSLEELRCDLTAFAQSLELEADGVSFARYVQYAILLDRLLRFPITGSRVRNYDGLGGQLLFAWLHRRGDLSWADNRLTVAWERVGAGVLALREQIEALYRAGIDRTKLQHWSAAHDLIAAVVAPATGSRWVAGVRDFTELEDPRPYCDLVLPDEFPLSIFYATLKAKLDVSVAAGAPTVSAQATGGTAAATAPSDAPAAPPAPAPVTTPALA
ncbi:DUF6421 family protein [Conexibacter sp. DBS9H8]|uniref:DUF6421 family protein n=1 Tax=Conexibacter sp. DBS9H8 TaxID=2937801 RepID=UPI00200E3AD5|nr:DUF6421 family protein [Conexibacter sp. DBS9H8]